MRNLWFYLKRMIRLNWICDETKSFMSILISVAQRWSLSSIIIRNYELLKSIFFPINMGMIACNKKFSPSHPTVVAVGCCMFDYFSIYIFIKRTGIGTHPMGPEFRLRKVWINSQNPILISLAAEPALFPVLWRWYGVSVSLHMVSTPVLISRILKNIK